MINIKQAKDNLLTCWDDEKYLGFVSYIEHKNLIVIKQYNIKNEYIDDVVKLVIQKFSKLTIPYNYDSNWIKFKTLDESSKFIKPYMEHVDWSSQFEWDVIWLINNSTFYYMMENNWVVNNDARQKLYSKVLFNN